MTGRNAAVSVTEVNINAQNNLFSHAFYSYDAKLAIKAHTKCPLLHIDSPNATLK